MKRDKITSVLKVSNWLLLSAVVYCAALLFDVPESSLQRLSASYDTEQFDEVSDSSSTAFEFFSSGEVSDASDNRCYRLSDSIYLVFILNRKYSLILKRLNLDYSVPYYTFQTRHYYPTDDDHETVA